MRNDRVVNRNDRLVYEPEFDAYFRSKPSACSRSCSEHCGANSQVATRREAEQKLGDNGAHDPVCSEAQCNSCRTVKNLAAGFLVWAVCGSSFRVATYRYLERMPFRVRPDRHRPPGGSNSVSCVARSRCSEYLFRRNIGVMLWSNTRIGIKTEQRHHCQLRSPATDSRWSQRPRCVPARPSSCFGIHR
jgi:hypothetical protein